MGLHDGEVVSPSILGSSDGCSEGKAVGAYEGCLLGLRVVGFLDGEVGMRDG